MKLIETGTLKSRIQMGIETELMGLKETLKYKQSVWYSQRALNEMLKYKKTAQGD